jgi:Cu/Ag efflux pump CusA
MRASPHPQAHTFRGDTLPWLEQAVSRCSAQSLDQVLRAARAAHLTPSLLIDAVNECAAIRCHLSNAMTAMPLSIGGAFVRMLLTGTELSMPALIGILMLMGIADKNAILLVDYMLERIRQGAPRREAIIEACLVRARPIIMTSLAMIAGMLPIALGLSLDSAFRAPMAIAAIGGLVSSTALNLILVPTMFSYVRDFEDWL